ncbi:hypothetical protein K440DRAFT_641813 [Wilcoxina mikolae CBS 423.85]|nr:hypothetical protein K440DRAFT_641813 [Wilcoxina mikolae CBS 423.85]
MQLCCMSMALWNACVGIFVHIDNNPQLLMASQASVVIEIQCTIADSLGLSSNQWNVGGSETRHEFSDVATIPATHYAPNVYETVDKIESIRFSSRLITLDTMGFEPSELCTAEYITKRQNDIDDGLGHFHEQAKHFAKIFDLNEILVAKVKDLEAADPIQGPNKELIAADQEIDELEKELLIEMHSSAQLERWLEKYKSEQVSTNQTDIVQLWLQKDILLHQVKSLSSENSELESVSRAFEHIIQPLTTNQVHKTPTSKIVSELNPSASGNCDSIELTPGSSGIRDSFKLTPRPSRNRRFLEPTPSPSGRYDFSIKSSNLPTYDGKRALDGVTAFLFTLE